MPYIDQVKVGNVTRDLQDTGARANEGTLANLTTTEKSNLVGAINEVNAAASDLKSQTTASTIVVQSESKPIVQIADGSANKAKSYDVQIVPQQAGSGDPSPTNVRPITGFTGAGVTRWGKNIADAATSTRAMVYRATTRPIDGNNGLYLCGASGSIDNAQAPIKKTAPKRGGSFVRNFVRNYFLIFVMATIKIERQTLMKESGIPRKINEKSATPYRARISLLAQSLGFEPKRKR